MNALIHLLTLLLLFSMCADRGFASSSSPVGRKIALLIGNDDYTEAHISSISPDKKPLNAITDMRTMARRLKSLGFEILGSAGYMNLDKAGLDQAISLFCEAAKQAETGIIYYCGHGAQINGYSLMLPCHMKLSNWEDISQNAVSVNTMVNQSRVAGLKNLLVIIDACRTPVAVTLPESIQTLADTFHPLRHPSDQDAGNILVCYATKAGMSAQPQHPAPDAAGYGFFCWEFVHALEENPKLSIQDLLRLTSSRMGRISRKISPPQIPDIHNVREDGDFYLMDEPERSSMPDSRVLTSVFEKKALTIKLPALPPFLNCAQAAEPPENNQLLLSMDINQSNHVLIHYQPEGLFYSKVPVASEFPDEPPKITWDGTGLPKVFEGDFFHSFESRTSRLRIQFLNGKPTIFSSGMLELPSAADNSHHFINLDNMSLDPPAVNLAEVLDPDSDVRLELLYSPQVDLFDAQNNVKQEAATLKIRFLYRFKEHTSYPVVRLQVNDESVLDFEPARNKRNNLSN